VDMLCYHSLQCGWQAKSVAGNILLKTYLPVRRLFSAGLLCRG